MVPTSMSDPSVRTLLLQRTRSHCRVENWNPRNRLDKLQQRRKWSFVEREKMEWSWPLEKNGRGASIDGGEALFIAKPPFTFLLIVGENVAGRTEATRLG